MSTRAMLFLASAALSGCTMGLGEYALQTCSDPAGSHDVQQVASLGSQPDITFASPGAASLLAAFNAPVHGGTCVQAVSQSGYVTPDCLFFGNDLTQIPRQPMVASVGPGLAGVAIKTTAPCTVGMLAVRFALPGPPVAVDLGCNAPPASAGAALPSLAALDSGRVLVSWLDVAFGSRADPISSSSCNDAGPTPLYVAAVSSSGSSAFPPAVQLADDVVSVRPAAVVVDPPDGVFVVAPAGGSVRVWQLDGNLQAVASADVDALAGARAVAATATNVGGVHRLAIAAEIGCAPQSIAVAVGDMSSGFQGFTASPANGAIAIAPSVSWVGYRGEYLVSWIAGTGGAHVMAQRVTADGQPVHGPIDARMQAIAAAATMGGDIVGFSAADSTFVQASMGCDP